MIGGIGYNVYVHSRNGGGGSQGVPNANWGGPNPLVPLNSISFPSKRALFASSYDWHFAEKTRRAYNRFGNDGALMVFFDGHLENVNKQQYDRAVDSPERF